MGPAEVLLTVTLLRTHRWLILAYTASWVLDLATKVPSSVEIYGVDINSQLFPSDVAPNLHFRTSSITDLPLDWSGKFALFHQRYLISALAEKEWIQACAEAYRVVADGGWVNFQEILLDYRADAWNWEPGPATLKLLALTRTIYDARGFLMDISLRLPAMLREANFGKVHVEERAFSLAGSEGADMRNNFFDGFRAMKTPVLNADGLGYVGSEVEFDEMMEVVGKEWEETPNAKFQVYVVYAQKTI